MNIQSLENDLTVSNLSITTTAQIEIPNPRFSGETISLDLRNIGQSGNTSLSSAGRIVLSNVNIQSNTNSNLAAGKITVISPEQVTFNNSQISSNTTSSGAAGDIIFNIADALTIDDSIVESSTTLGSQGRGGNINVFNSGATTLTNGSSFSLDSEGQGTGGNLNLTSGSLTLENSTITSTTRKSNGGNFSFNLDDYLLLRNGSLISTEAGTAGAGGNGGNININVPNGFIVAQPDENSDIRANAFEGDGGNVNITARNLLGIAFRPGVSDTPASDITASSEFGNSGTVIVNELNAETLQPETELPVETAPATVARGCRAQGTQTGSFVSTGRGGLPTSPVDLVSANTLWQDLEPLASTSESGPISNRALRASQPPATIVSSTEKTITEAQGWHRADDGTVTLLAPSVESSFSLAQANGCGS